jgi:hypothetical protein
MCSPFCTHCILRCDFFSTKLRWEIMRIVHYKQLFFPHAMVDSSTNSDIREQHLQNIFLALVPRYIIKWIQSRRKSVEDHVHWPPRLNELYFQDHTTCKSGLENVVHPVRLSSISANLFVFIHQPGVITWNLWALCAFEHGASRQPQAVMDGACLAAENQGKWLMCAPHAILAVPVLHQQVRRIFIRLLQ